VGQEHRETSSCATIDFDGDLIFTDHENADEADENRSRFYRNFDSRGSSRNSSSFRLKNAPKRLRPRRAEEDFADIIVKAKIQDRQAHARRVADNDRTTSRASV